MNDFDEAWYLQTNKDVADSVARGDWASGYAHYLEIGKSKGRLGSALIDEAWYMAAYPLARAEVESEKFSGYAHHYSEIGQYRGYLPRQKAARSENPSDFRSRFGGLWVDQRNALDLLAGRLELGTISKDQAGMLFKWITEGFIIIKNAIPPVFVERALAEVNKAYDGDIPSLRFQIHGVGQNLGWVPEAKVAPTKALDLHWLSEPVRDLIFAPKVLDFLHLIFERRALASQTLTFWRGSGQDGHQDSAYVNYSLPMQFAASWIALEDAQEGAGELFYHVGSHHMPEYLYQGKYKGVEEAARIGGESNSLGVEIKDHIERIASQAESMSLKTEKLFAKAGDVLFWSADLAHGGAPISKALTRKSVVTQYCPAEAVPSYFENHPGVEIRSHRGSAWYASGQYR